MEITETTAKEKTEFKIKLEKFEGPFDVLLHLIDEKKIEIYDISISDITSSYLAYLEQLRSLDLEVAGEFLLMAAILIEMKSRMLLPVGSVVDSEALLEAEAARKALLEKLIEYKSFKQLAVKLVEREEIFSHALTREHINRHYLSANFNVKQNLILKNATSEEFLRAFQKVWQDFELRVLTREIDHVSPMLFSVRDKMYEIVEKLQHHHARIMFTELFLSVSNKYEIIATFLAILELIKQQLLLAVQNDLFDDIEIIARKNLQKEDLATIVGDVDEYNKVASFEDENTEGKDESDPEDLAGTAQADDQNIQFMAQAGQATD